MVVHTSRSEPSNRRFIAIQWFLPDCTCWFAERSRESGSGQGLLMLILGEQFGRLFVQYKKTLGERTERWQVSGVRNVLTSSIVKLAILAGETMYPSSTENHGGGNQQLLLRHTKSKMGIFNTSIMHNP